MYLSGDKAPRKSGPSTTRSDLLVMSKIDLAPLVGASLAVLDADSRGMHGKRLYVFANMQSGQVLDEIIGFIEREGC